MMLSMDQPEFVIDSTDGSNPIGKRVANQQQFRTGYRAKTHFTFCQERNELSVQWTHFPQIEVQKTRSGANLFGILYYPVDVIAGASGEATITDKFTCFLLDGLFKRKVVSNPCFSFALHAGVQYGYLSFKERVKYTIPAARDRDVGYTSRIRGIGPEIGVDYRFCFLGSWHFGGRVDNGWLVAETVASVKDASSNGSIASAHNDDYIKLIPTLDLQLGLGFTPKICGISLELEVGYELIAFLRGSERIYFVDTFNEGSSFNEKLTLSMHGPYAHVGVSF